MSDASRGAARVPIDERDERIFIDSEGVRWRVYEQPFSTYDRRGQSLIFISDAAVRRVREYPADWRALSDAELTTLSWRA